MQSSDRVALKFGYLSDIFSSYPGEFLLKTPTEEFLGYNNVLKGSVFTLERYTDQISIAIERSKVLFSCAECDGKGSAVARSN